jgi:long-chain acyl-CoA synthetase
MTTGSMTRTATPQGSAAPGTSTVAVAPQPHVHSALDLSTGASTVGEMILRAERRNGVALRYRQAGSWRELSYHKLVRSARDIARGLIALGIEPGERVSILADTRPEWTIADAGCFCAAAVVAPIYQTDSPEECEYVLRHSEARVVFCEDATQLAKIEQIRDRCPALEHVIAFNDARDGSTGGPGFRTRR